MGVRVAVIERVATTDGSTADESTALEARAPSPSASTSVIWRETRAGIIRRRSNQGVRIATCRPGSVNRCSRIAPYGCGSGVSPSCASSTLSIATLVLSAVNCGPTHLTGKALMKFHLTTALPF